MPYPVSFQKRFKTILKDRWHVLLFAFLCYDQQREQSRQADNIMGRALNGDSENLNSNPSSATNEYWPWTSPLNLSGLQFSALSTALWFSSLIHCSFPVPGIRLYKLRWAGAGGGAIYEFSENGHVISYLPFYISRWVLAYQAFIK